MTDTQDVISAAQFRAGMLAAGARIGEERDALSELDAAAGDGDLGATLAAGFAHVEEALVEVPPDDVGALIKQAGVTLARKAPSTIGALLGGAFMKVSADFQGASDLTAQDVVRLMSALLVAVSDRGGAVPGQRTIVDALDGASTAATEASTAGAGAQTTLSASATGAAAAADRTAEMEPQFGRAAWVSERARGHRDAGAVAWSIYLQALSDAVASANPAAGV
jgi:dihydroxyacetone kinase-like protein